jgi:hypothetical protein
MNEPIINKIADYVKSQSRNKIIFHSHEISDILTINIGLSISETIYSFQNQEKISIRVSSELDEILNKAIFNNDVFGRYISIENLGILFEPDLKLDFTRLLEKFSQNNVLFVKWDGEIGTDNIYFLTKENGIKINIKNLSHIAL